MYELYDEIPINVVILESNSLKILYINNKFKNTFSLNEDVVGSSLEDISQFKRCIIIQALINKCSNKIKKISLVENMFFDVMFEYKEELTSLFIYEVTDYIERESRIKEEREKFLSIWSEMKTKCDIIQQLRQKEKKYLLHLKDVINNLSEGLIVLDEYGDIEFFNKAASKIIGLGSKKVCDYKDIFKGLNVYGMDLTNFNIDLDKLYKDYLSNKKPVKDRIIKINMDNLIKYIEISCTPVKDKNDKLINSIITIKDITKVIEHEIELKVKNEELEKFTRMKDDYFNIMSHELRTPLTIIHSSLQLARDVYTNEITDNIDKILSKINQNSRRLLKLINNVLDVSKAESGFLQLDYKPYDVVYITENLINSVNLYAKSKSIELIFDTTEEEAIVLLDRDKYERIVLNLLSNSIKFTPSNKSILVTNVIEENYFEVRVKDEGIGIPKDKVNMIFERFTQVDNSLSKHSYGTGLGLSLVKKLVELMGGTINVESEEGKGTEFIVRLPKNKIYKNDIEYDSCQHELNNNKIIIEFSDVS